MTGSLFEDADGSASDQCVKCLGCKVWFRGVRELRAEDWRHADGCERPGEVWA